MRARAPTGAADRPRPRPARCAAARRRAGRPRPRPSPRRRPARVLFTATATCPSAKRALASRCAASLMRRRRRQRLRQHLDVEPRRGRRRRRGQLRPQPRPRLARRHPVARARDRQRQRRPGRAQRRRHAKARRRRARASRAGPARRRAAARAAPAGARAISVTVARATSMRPTGGAPASASAAARDGGTGGAGGASSRAARSSSATCARRRRAPASAPATPPAARAAAACRRGASPRPRHVEPVDAQRAPAPRPAAPAACAPPAESTRRPENSATCVAVQSTSSPVLACAMRHQAPLEPRPIERAHQPPPGRPAPAPPAAPPPPARAEPSAAGRRGTTGSGRTDGSVCGIRSHCPLAHWASAVQAQPVGLTHRRRRCLADALPAQARRRPSAPACRRPALGAHRFVGRAVEGGAERGDRWRSRRSRCSAWCTPPCPHGPSQVRSPKHSLVVVQLMNDGIIGTQALKLPIVPQVIGMCSAAAIVSQSDGEEQPWTHTAAAPPNAPSPIIGTMPMSARGRHAGGLGVELARVAVAQAGHREEDAARSCGTRRRDRCYATRSRDCHPRS